jgi:hypothetical protein
MDDRCATLGSRTSRPVSAVFLRSRSARALRSQQVPNSRLGKRIDRHRLLPVEDPPGGGSSGARPAIRASGATSPMPWGPAVNRTPFAVCHL